VRPVDVVAVGALHLAAGEHVHPTAEHGGQRAAQHEHLDATGVGVADEHHRRRRLHGDGGRVEGSLVAHRG
jgi:hypothetical protein